MSAHVLQKAVLVTEDVQKEHRPTPEEVIGIERAERIFYEQKLLLRMRKKDILEISSRIPTMTAQHPLSHDTTFPNNSPPLHLSTVWGRYVVPQFIP
jgi:hypothetical protein